MSRTHKAGRNLHQRDLATTIYANQVANAAYALQQARQYLIYLSQISTGADRERHLAALAQVYALERQVQDLPLAAEASRENGGGNSGIPAYHNACR